MLKRSGLESCFATKLEIGTQMSQTIEEVAPATTSYNKNLFFNNHFAFNMIDAGYSLVPIKYMEKGPKLNGWSKKPPGYYNNTIRQSLATGGKINYGVITGQQSGVMVLDVDYPKDKPLQSAVDWYEKAKIEYPELTNTFTVKTGSGGYHLYFVYDKEISDNIPRADINGYSFDFRSDGGQVVGPDSVHPNGNKYEVVDGDEPQPMPEWLAKWLQKKKEPVQPVHTEEIDLDDDQLEQIKEDIEEHSGDWATIRQINGSLVHMTRTKPSFCDTCDREHENENPFYSLKKYKGVISLKYHCGRSSKWGKIIKKYGNESSGGDLKTLLEERNKRFAHVNAKKPFIIDEKTGIFYPHSSFLAVRSNDIETIGEKEKNISHAWLKSKERRDYERIDFNPQITGNYHDEARDHRVFNMWRGYRNVQQPDANYQNDVDKFKFHIREVWCRGNSDYADYICKWFACVIVKRIKTRVALVLKSTKEQTGKGIVLDEIISKIMGSYFLTTAHGEAILTWNDCLQDKLLLNWNEASWGGDKKLEGRLKNLITDPTMAVNEKYMSINVVNSYVNAIIYSNNDWIVPAKQGSQRYFCLEISEEWQRNFDYFREFAKINHWNIYHWLCSLDLTEFNPRDFPETELMREQIQFSRTPTENYFYDYILAGEYDDEYTPKDDIYADFQSKSPHRYTSNGIFFKDLKKLCQSNNVMFEEKKMQKQSPLGEYGVSKRMRHVRFILPKE